VNAAIAASAVLPVLLTGEMAQASSTDIFRRTAPVLVPLLDLIFPIVAMGLFTLYVFSEDAWWWLIPGSKKQREILKIQLADPVFARRMDPLGGLVNRDDWEKGLEEAWEKAKPDGCTITVQDKLKELATQNAPHYWKNDAEFDWDWKKKWDYKTMGGPGGYDETGNRGNFNSA